MKKFFLFVLLFMISPSLFAAGAFDVSSLDKSMTYLGGVFGQVGTVLIGDGNAIFAELIKVMNTIIFTLGIIIIIYTSAMSTIHTAQEGEILGKKMSTFWVPVRAALGLFLLLPSPGSGYSYIQILVMYFISQGVGAANALWSRVLDGMMSGETLHQTQEGTAEIANQNQTISNLLKSEFCRAIINNNPGYLQLINEEPITYFKVGDKLIWGTQSNTKEICGSVSIPNFQSIVDSARALIGGGVVLDDAPLKAIFANMIESSTLDLQPIAEEGLTEPNLLDRTNVTNLSYVSRSITNGMKEIVDYYKNLIAPTDIISVAKVDGWIHAGAYYFIIVTGIAQAESNKYIDVPYTAPTLDFLPKDDQDNVNALINQKVAESFQAAKLLFGTKPHREQLGEGIPIIPSTTASGIQGWDSTLGSLFKQLAFLIMDSIHNYDSRDPLISISKVGQEIMRVIEITFWVMVGVLALLAIGSVMQCLNPVFGIISTIAFFFSTLFLIVSSILYPAAVVMGLYTPLIPWLVFTFSAIGWILLVIEAIVAAPLIALVLVVPSEDEMGKAGHSIVILTGLIFRPALMIIGFVAGGKLMVVAMHMLNFGFKEMVLANIHGIGVFGCIALIVFYCGVVTVIIHQSFGLIYQIPDKVLRWMGGQAEGQDVAGKLAQIKGYAQKGGQAGMGVMSGTTSGLMKAGKSG